MTTSLSNTLDKNLPSVTVIMPVRNEAAFIEHSLGAVLAQDYPHDRVEVLIADGMSTDDTRDVIARLTAAQDIPVTVLDNPGRIVSSGLNTAIRQAGGEVIVRVDGHAVIQPDYVRKCVECLIENDVDCVGGAVESVGSGYLGKAIATAMSSLFGVGDSGFRTSADTDKPQLTDTVPFGVYRRDVFERVGLFNEKMVRHQDYEFSHRLRMAGGLIMLLPSARPIYYVRSSLTNLWKQYWQYGLWKGSFLRVHPNSLKLRHLAPPLFVFVMIISSLLAIISRAGFALLGVVLGAYAASMLAVLISLSLNGKFRYTPVLPIIFVCLHASWGLGVWLGLLSPKISLSSHKEPSL